MSETERAAVLAFVEKVKQRAKAYRDSPSIDKRCSWDLHIRTAFYNEVEAVLAQRP